MPRETFAVSHRGATVQFTAGRPLWVDGDLLALLMETDRTFD